MFCRSSQLCSATMLRVRFHVQAFSTHTPLPGCQVPTRLSVQHHYCSQCLSRVACRSRVLVRLSHPRPPDRNQHGCIVGVLPGTTRVLPRPRQYGIGRRAPTRAVLSCAASWCLVVRRPRRRVECLVLTCCFLFPLAHSFPKLSSHLVLPLILKICRTFVSL